MEKRQKLPRNTYKKVKVFHHHGFCSFPSSLKSLSGLSWLRRFWMHLPVVTTPKRTNKMEVVMRICAIGGRAAMSLYGVGRVVLSSTKAILAFCRAVSMDTATICGRPSRATQAKRPPNEKPAIATHSPATSNVQSRRMKMCDML